MSFVLISLLIGVVAYYIKYKDELVKDKNYDYSAQDSLFEGVTELSYNQKEVDYKQELSNFSDNELESVSTKININTAGVNELVLLPGIGKKTARKIVKYRKKHGRFKRLKDLRRIKGIGKKKLKKIKGLLIIE